MINISLKQLQHVITDIGLSRYIVHAIPFRNRLYRIESVNPRKKYSDVWKDMYTVVIAGKGYLLPISCGVFSIPSFMDLQELTIIRESLYSVDLLISHSGVDIGTVIKTPDGNRYGTCVFLDQIGNDDSGEVWALIHRTNSWTIPENGDTKILDKIHV